MLQSVVEVVGGPLAIPGETSAQIKSDSSGISSHQYLPSSVSGTPTLDLSTCKTKSEVWPLEKERSASTFEWFPFLASRKIVA